MLYLDYSRKPGEWIPNQYGGNENLEAIDFLRRFNELAHTGARARSRWPRNPPRWPGVSKPVYLNGLGFTMKWNMGWMHDMLDYFSQRSHLPQVPPQQHHLQPAVRLHREFHAADLARRGGARQGLAAEQDAGRRVAAVRQRARVPGLHVRRIPARSCCSWARRSARREEWNHNDGRAAGSCCNFDYHRKLQTLVRELNRLYRAEPALYQVDFHLRRLRVDRFPRRGELASSPSCARARIARISCCSAATSRRCRGRAIASACRARASIARSSTPIRRCSAAATWATAGWSRRSRSRFMGGRAA